LCTLLDIGTGSGCIAITLAAEMPEAEVTAWDISAEALSVACENAKRTHVHVSFEQVDILHLPSSVIHLTSAFDLIVSNPPYICNKERATMEANVLEHEPHTALFVPDDDPLLFYRAIAQYASTALKPGGWLYFEINPLYAKPLRDMLNMMLYHDIEIKEDQYGKQRMIRAKKVISDK
jgi:release factor glutamine methyltransferase